MRRPTRRPSAGPLVASAGRPRYPIIYPYPHPEQQAQAEAAARRDRLTGASSDVTWDYHV